MARDICGHCLYLDLKNCRSNGTCYCTEWHRYEKPNSGCCSSFALDYEKVRNSRYYITTEVVEALGLGREDFHYTTIRDFRENVLQPDERYTDALDAYDLVGPIIVDRIQNDENRENVCYDLLGSIHNTCIHILDGNNDAAVNTYSAMVSSLLNHYGLNYNEIKMNAMQGFADYVCEEFAKHKDFGSAHMLLEEPGLTRVRTKKNKNIKNA